jgi:3,4-dihydroxy 2-butanone 4-phosphate synthase/GTP cyclohydrolase II
MLRRPKLLAFASQHGLVTVSVGDLVRYRRSVGERLVDRSGESRLPTAHGDFAAIAYRSRVDGAEHLALVMGDVRGRQRDSEGVLVRVHSECLTGDTFGSLRCDCGTQLNRSMAAIAEEGRGVIVYLRAHEGRGIGLSHKLRAYSLQERGIDTVDANLRLGLPVDSREYGIGAEILNDLEIQRIRLITNNPDKYSGLSGYDFEIVGRVSMPVDVTPHNIDYLRTKRDRMGHLLPVLAEDLTSTAGGHDI